ncbi:MAG: pantoate--beta-alanine ligase [Gammaproteobacteria bacterium]
MHTMGTISELRAAVRRWRSGGATIAFVPTMGNLHRGHLQLVSRARKLADRVVVSIFVNPTQFAAGEDFETYPRTEEQDRKKLSEAGADMLFLPSVSEIYASDAKTVVTVSGLSERLCGEFRPGHFSGVATVVCKLFNIVQPDCAFFGQKDFQQLTLIQTMVRDLNIPVEIMPVETVREASGLAMSSRNGYLNDEEKKIAPLLYRALCDAQRAVLANNRERVEIERQACDFLQNAGFKTDYFSICRRSDLKTADRSDRELVILAAAKLGRTRLIDNICFNRPEE